MKTKILLGIAIVSFIVWALQLTPAAFLPKDVTDFVGGFTIGMVIATIIAVWATRTGTTAR
jgi:hypothetical protein